MANYSNLIAAIQAAIYNNGQNLITGSALQGVLVDMVEELGQAGALFGGVVKPTDSPTSSDSNLFYIAAEAGTYTNFGGAVVGDGELCIFTYGGGSWKASKIPEYLDASVVYTFDPASSPVAVLDEDIVLNSEGDSIEFDVLSCGFTYSYNDGYSFAARNATNMIAIGLFSNHTVVRCDDNTWIDTATSPVGKHFKLVYENGGLSLYLDGILQGTAAGKTTTIHQFGYNTAYNYWSGIVKNFKVNGEDWLLALHSTPSGITVANHSTFLTETEREQLAPEMLVEKTASQFVVYLKVPGTADYFAYPVAYRYKAYTSGQYPSFFDNWGIGRCYVASFSDGVMSQKTLLFQPGEAEFATDVTSGADASQQKFVGGAAHGFENIVVGGDGREVLLLVDEQAVGETDTFSLRPCKSVRLITNAEVYQAYTNSNPWAQVRKEWNWADGVMTLNIQLTVLRVLTTGSTYMGMMCVYRRSEGNASNPYLTNRSIKMDNPFKTYITTDGWWDDAANAGLLVPSHDCKEVVEYGELGYGFSMKVVDATIKTNGGMFVNNNASNNQYNKIYLDLTRSGYTPSVNEVLSATVKWTML